MCLYMVPDAKEKQPAAAFKCNNDDDDDDGRSAQILADSLMKVNQTQTLLIEHKHKHKCCVFTCSLAQK